MRGALIALEGLDRTGKTTQIAALERFLAERGAQPLSQKFPDRSTPLGRHIDGFLRSREQLGAECLHLLFAANRWELVPALENALAAGRHVLLDRYIHSGIAYSHAQGLPLEWCTAPERGLPRPDLVIYLRADAVEDLAARGEYGGEVFERVEFQRKVERVYNEHLVAPEWLVLGASRPAAEVERELCAAVARFLDDFDGAAPLRRF